MTCEGGRSYYKGLELVCRKRLEAYFANESGEFKRRGVLQVNFTFTVLEASKAALVLDDLEGGRVRITLAQALQYFSYSHAFTGHAQQGMSVDGAVTIFDHRVSWLSDDGAVCGVNAQWVYTALSRARNLEKLYVFVGALSAPVNEREFEIAMQRKIHSYKAADNKAGGRGWRRTMWASQTSRACWAHSAGAAQAVGVYCSSAGPRATTKSSPWTARTMPRPT